MDDARSALTRPQGWALALTATLTMAVSYVDRQTLAVLAPTVTKALGISDAAYGWLVSAFSIAYLVGAPPAGQLIDRLGARRGLLGAVGTWSLVAALHALVPGFGVLFGLRIALGLAEAPSFPGAAQTIHRALPPEDRARGFGVLFTGSSIGAMVAPPLATWLAGHYGWRVAFLGTAACGLVWVPIWLSVAWTGRARAALDARPSGEAGASSSPSVARAADAPSAPRAGSTISPLQLLTHPAVLRTIAVVLASSPVLSFVLNWGAKYLVRDHHLTQADVGRYLWLPPVMFDVGAIAFGHFASRRARALGDGSPPRALLAAAMCLCALGAVIPFAGGPWPAMITAGVCLAGGGGLFALATADMLARVPPGAVSTAGGITAAAQSLAYIVANPLVGRWVEYLGSYRVILEVLGLWVLPGSLIWLFWKPPPSVNR